MRAIHQLAAILPVFLFACATAPDSSDDTTDVSPAPGDGVVIQHRSAAEMRARLGGDLLVGTSTLPSSFPTFRSYFESVATVAPAETCPGNLVTLGLEQSVTLTGSTVGGNDDYKEWCGDADANTSALDHVYQIQIDQACTLGVFLDEHANFNGVVAIRPAATCATETVASDFCMNSSTSGESFQMEMQPGAYSIIVDGATTDEAGSYDVLVTCGTPTCGDGVLNAGEECDGGGISASDGCGDPLATNACQLEPAVAADTCADLANGTPISINTNDTLLIPASDPIFNSSSGADDYESPDCSWVGAGAHDQVFEFVPASSGNLSVTVGADALGMDTCQPPYDQSSCFIHALWFRTGDCETSADISCAWSQAYPTTSITTLTIAVTSGEHYYLFVEGNSSSKALGENGPYLLTASLQ